MLSLKDISKSFSQRGIVLDNLNLDVNEGDSVSIMGPSGSGKTTMLNIIGLLDKPDKGTISFQGKSIASYNDDESSDYRNKNIGFVFQDHLLLPYLTVSENIFLPLLATKKTPDELDFKVSRLKTIMDRTGIYDLKDKYPFNISGGEAQRVAMARALANNPSILVADEPTGSLDTKNSTILGDLLIEINMEFGITVILATHSLDLAKRMKKKYRLENGRLTELSIDI
jgi:lipoprotein-releasing system ATP-binding protein